MSSNGGPGNPMFKSLLADLITPLLLAINLVKMKEENEINEC
jgi:hypothetical protein